MRKPARRLRPSRESFRKIRRALLAFARLAPALLAAACAGPRLAPPGPGAEAPGLAFAHFRTADGLRLPLRIWRPHQDRPATAVVLALHGFNDYSGAFRDAAPKLAAGGAIVYAYDQRGFGAAPNRGLWPGADRLIEDARTAARLIRRRHPDLPFYLLGLSMGGAVVMNALAEDPDLAAGAILVAPAVRGRAAIPKWQLWSLDVAVATIPWYPATGQGLRIRPTDNIEALRRMARDPNVLKETRLDAVYGLVDLMTRAARNAARQRAPLLLLYGLKDDLVPMAPTLAALDALPETSPGRPPHRLAVYEDGHHMLLRDLDNAIPIRDIRAWIRNPAGPLPSGADAAARARLARALEAE